MRIWTIAALKGGVGKTTTTINLAGALLREGARVLLVDLDPRGVLTDYCGLDPDRTEPNVHAVFEAAANGATRHLAEVLHGTRIRDLHIAPAAAALLTLDRRFGARSGMGLALARSLRTVAGEYDYCLVDCPPMLGVLVINALVCCEQLIVPVQTEFLAEQSLDRLMHTLQMVERSRRAPLPHLVVPTMFDRRTRASAATLAAIRHRRDLSLWDEYIPVDPQFREAGRAGEPLTLRQPYARGSIAYQHLLAALRGETAQFEPMRAAG